MTRQAVPLYADDISQFSRALARQLGDEQSPPSHLSLMNMLARASGFRNFQHLKAAHAAGERLALPEVAEAVDYRSVEKALGWFDAEGRLKQWPVKRKLQDVALWALWARLPAGVVMQEPEVNTRLLEHHNFEDPAILRRCLCALGLMTRNRDGSDYQRVEQKPPAEARALIRVLEERR
jgi:hypothetical protein